MRHPIVRFARARPRLNFASPTFWDDRYADDPDDETEWLLAYDGALANAIESHAGASRGLPLLELGCGSSPLCAQLHAAGFEDILATDVSAAAVRAAAARHSLPGLRFEKADALALPFADESFATVIDKGTLDAILCSDAFDVDVPRMAREVERVLRRDGRWLCVSLNQPALVLPLLQSVGSLRVSAVPLARPEWAQSPAAVAEVVGLGAPPLVAAGGTHMYLCSPSS